MELKIPHSLPHEACNKETSRRGRISEFFLPKFERKTPKLLSLYKL
jgi:hypothetical protein